MTIQPSKVCVLLAAHNGASFIASQISSILSQIEVLVDIYISIDFSEDDTVEIVERYAENFDNVRLVSQNERFGSAGKNFYHLIESIDVSAYHYVAFSDQDDIWFPDKLLYAINSIDSNKVSGFSSDVYAFWPDNGVVSTVAKSSPQVEFDHFFESPGPGCSQVFTSKSFLEFQIFFSNNKIELLEFDYHDWLIYAYYRESGLGWFISDSPRMLYIQHAHNQIGVNSGALGIFRRIKMIKSNWYREQISILSVVFQRPDLLSGRFVFRNIFLLRRNKFLSVFVGLMLLFRFM